MQSNNSLSMSKLNDPQQQGIFFFFSQSLDFLNIFTNFLICFELKFYILFLQVLGFEDKTSTAVAINWYKIIFYKKKKNNFKNSNILKINNLIHFYNDL